MANNITDIQQRMDIEMTMVYHKVISSFAYNNLSTVMETNSVIYNLLLDKL